MEITLTRGNAVYLRFQVFFESNGKLKPITEEFMRKLFDMIFEDKPSVIRGQDYIIRIVNY